MRSFTTNYCKCTIIKNRETYVSKTGRLYRVTSRFRKVRLYVCYLNGNAWAPEAGNLFYIAAQRCDHLKIINVDFKENLISFLKRKRSFKTIMLKILFVFSLYRYIDFIKKIETIYIWIFIKILCIRFLFLQNFQDCILSKWL